MTICPKCGNDALYCNCSVVVMGQKYDASKFETVPVAPMTDQHSETAIERITEHQLQDLFLPCDMRDIRIRIAGALTELSAIHAADKAKLEAEVQSFQKSNAEIVQTAAQQIFKVQAENDSLRATIEGLTAQHAKDIHFTSYKGAYDHLNACRGLLDVPEDEVLYDAINDLIEEVDLLRGQIPQWRPISEAPKDGTFVLLGFKYYPNIKTVADWIGEPHNCWRGGINPTHFMPLPSGPLTGEGKE